MASSSNFTPILTATPSAPPTYNVGMAETFSWIPVEGAGRPLFARATYLANPEDIKISLSASNINVSLDELELNTDNIEELVDITNNSLTAFKFETDINFERTNTLLEVLTSTQQESVSLLHALTANTDDLEELVIENNTLLNSLTALTQSEFDETQTLLTNKFDSLTALTQSEFNETQTLLTNEFNETQTLLSSLTAITQSEFNETQTLLDSLTALQEDKQSQIVTLLHQLTANTDELEINTDGVETLLNSLTALTQSEFNETQTLLDSLTALQNDKQSQIITLLHQLTANTDELEINLDNLEINTDGVETLLDSLTALTQSEFNETQTLLSSLTALTQSEFDETQTLLTNEFHSLTALTQSEFDETQTLLTAKFDSLTSITQSEFDETQTLLVSLTALQEDKQTQVITLLHQLTANTDSLEVNTDEVEVLLSGTNVLLNALTAVDYATASKQDSIITLLDSLTAKETTISLDVSAINLNTDEIEGLIKTSNTLLDALTAKQTVTDVTGIETRLDVLTAVNYATATKQDSVITLLDALTAKQTVTDVTGLETRLDVLTAVDYSTATKQDVIITLLDSLTAKQTTVNLDVSAINLNTDEIEGLIQVSNTLLNALTAKQTVTDVTGIETRLDVLTAVDYATSAKQDESNSLLSGLTAIQVDKQDQIITLLHAITGTAIEIDLNADQIDLHVDDVETLLHSLTASNIRVPGFSIPPYDEISLDYYGSTNNLSNVIYKNNTTDVLSLSFVYVPNPPTTNDALLASVKKI